MTADVWIGVATFAAGLGAGAIIGRTRRAPPTGQDIPAQQEASAPADDRFDALVRALPLGVMMLNRNLRVRFANRAAGAIFGFDYSRARGRHLIATVPSIELEQRAEAALRGERSGTPIIVSGKAVNRSYAVSLYPLSSDGGEDTDHADDVSGVLIIAEDQTELLALERARQEFLTNVSHELRTPLSSIKLMLETVEEAGDEEARAMFLPQVLGQVDRLAALVQRLLEQAQAESGEMVLQISEVDLEEVARPIIGAFQPQAASAEVNLELRTLRPAIILADEQRLSQIFVNLIDNALRYTPQGGSVTVTIDVEQGYAVIRVSDTGIGIPFKDQPYVFDRFYVVDRSRARAGTGSGGAGLGLAIVKQIAHAHGGSVDVSSTLGRGATFIVRLPVVSRQS
ncbi:MAG TPA: ATP-binding protein [Candidatus Baltobacteraceae bacterium]|jgi:two-component system phosphate regulon sensor histidine kinase PhoR|nr:ATP-binding protein [Candidatus Baltobacteraceae bacterium]